MNGSYVDGFNCTRRVGGFIGRIPRRWLCDGQVDCEGGGDEDRSLWKICHGNCIEKTKKCGSSLKCDDGRFVRSVDLCSGIDKCETERRVCRGKTNLIVSQKVVRLDGKVYIGPCLPGLTITLCDTIEVSLPEAAFGTSPTTLVLPRSLVDCRHYYGEA